MSEMIGPVNGTQAGPKTVFNEFFGQVVSGVSEGISRIGTEILPNWVKSELDLQSDDQLQRSLFEPEGLPAPRRLDSMLTTQLAEGTNIPAMNRNIGFLMDNFNVQITGLQLGIAVVAFVGTFWVLRKVL